MKKETLLATGEFARLCGTTKETLFHYDRENLLKPRHVSANGYRYYGAEQFFDFDMITMLKETGSTLKEVGACVRDKDSGAFLALLETGRAAVKKERKKLAQQEAMIRDLTDRMCEALTCNYDTVTVQFQREERLEIFSPTMGPGDAAPGFTEWLAECIDFCIGQKRKPMYPFGIILSRKAAEKGIYLERLFFCRGMRETPRSRQHVKPEGRYAALAHRGTAQSHRQAFRELLRRIKAQGLAVAGSVYVYDMMCYIWREPREDYAMRYCVRVE